MSSSAGRDLDHSQMFPIDHDLGHRYRHLATQNDVGIRIEPHGPKDVLDPFPGLEMDVLDLFIEINMDDR